MAMKGKEIAGKGKASSTGKRKSVSKPDDSGNESRLKRNRSSALKFFDTEAADAGIGDEEEEDSEDEVDKGKKGRNESEKCLFP